jgi:glycosyltransferase involved in cell wall biosynthesis
MTLTPLVRVIMPAFNCGEYIGAAIDSVTAQTHQHWRLVIVDDGSTDQTGTIADEYARRDPERIRVVHQRNAGIARARNRALADGDGHCEWTTFLDSDDVWFPNALAAMLSAADRASDSIVGVHGFRTYLDRAGRPLTINGASYAPLRRRAVYHGGLRTVAPTAPTTFEVLAYGCCVFTGALLVRTAALQRAGLFDPDAVPAEDWDMWLRLSLQGPFAFLPQPLYGYRLHGTNSTANATRKHKSLYYVRRKCVADASLPYARRATMMAGFRWYEIYRASVGFRQLFRCVGAGGRGEASRLVVDALGHLWASVQPGGRRLAVLGAESGDRVRT